MLKTLQDFGGVFITGKGGGFVYLGEGIVCLISVLARALPRTIGGVVPF